MSYTSKEIHLRFSDELGSRIDEAAGEEGISSNAFIAKACSWYLAKDTTDEAMIGARFTNIDRQEQKILLSIDVFENMLMFYMKYFFYLMPEPDKAGPGNPRFRKAAINADEWFKAWAAETKRTRPDMWNHIHAVLSGQDDGSGKLMKENGSDLQ